MTATHRFAAGIRSPNSSGGICRLCAVKGAPGWFPFEGGVQAMECPFGQDKLAPACYAGPADLPTAIYSPRDPGWEWGDDGL